VDDLPGDGRCELAWLNWQGTPLKVSIAADSLTRSSTLPADLAGLPAGWLQVVPRTQEADWVLRRDAESLVLEPMAAWSGDRPSGALTIGGSGEEANFESTVQRLRVIAHAQNLVRLAADVSAIGPADSKKSLVVNLVSVRDASDAEGQVITAGPEGFELHPGDLVGVRAENHTSAPLDITLLYVDAQSGVTPVYPTAGSGNRVFPGEKLMLFSSAMSEPLGIEHLVVVAVPGNGPPTNFRLLAVPPGIPPDPNEEQPALRGGTSAVANLLGFTDDDAPLYRSGGSDILTGYNLQLITWCLTEKPAE
jgi:hypothetical protein